MEDRAAMAPHRLGPVALQRVVAGLRLQAGAEDAVGLLRLVDRMRRLGELLVVGRHGDAVLLQQAGLQHIISRHAPHVGLVALADRGCRQRGAEAAETRSENACTGHRQHLPAAHSRV